MKDLLSKEHYCFEIHTLLMKSTAYPLQKSQPPISKTEFHSVGVLSLFCVC